MPDKTPAWAIIRVDNYGDPLSASNVEQRVTVTKVLLDQNQADTEVARLNTLRDSDHSATYFAQYTRLLV